MGSKDSIREFQILIDGTWCDAASRSKLDVLNPATEEVMARIQLCDPQDVDRAARAAQKAFGDWKAKDPKARASLMHKGTALVRERAEDLSRLLTAEMGKPLGDARKEIADSAGIEVLAHLPIDPLVTELGDRGKIEEVKLVEIEDLAARILRIEQVKNM